MQVSVICHLALSQLFLQVIRNMTFDMFFFSFHTASATTRTREEDTAEITPDLEARQYGSERGPYFSEEHMSCRLLQLHV